MSSVPGLVRLADWSRLLVSVEGHPLRLDRGHFLGHRRILDLRQGMLWREWRHQDEGGRVTILRELRFASLADRHLLVQSVTLTPADYSGRVSIDATPTGALTHITESGVAIAMVVCTHLIDPEGRATDFNGQLSLQMGCGQTYCLNRVFGDPNRYFFRPEGGIDGPKIPGLYPGGSLSSEPLLIHLVRFANVRYLAYNSFESV